MDLIKIEEFFKKYATKDRDYQGFNLDENQFRSASNELIDSVAEKYENDISDKNNYIETLESVIETLLNDSGIALETANSKIEILAEENKNLWDLQDNFIKVTIPTLEKTRDAHYGELHNLRQLNEINNRIISSLETQIKIYDKMHPEFITGEQLNKETDESLRASLNNEVMG